MKPNNQTPQSKPQNSLNEFLTKNSLNIAPKQHIAYSKITFSPKSFLYSPKKNQLPQNTSTNEKNESVIENTSLTKSELLLNPNSPTPLTQPSKIDGASATTNGFYMYNPKTKNMGQSIFIEKNATTINEPKYNTFYIDKTTEVSSQVQEDYSKETSNKKKKNLEIQTKFSYGKPFPVLKSESAQNNHSQTSKNWSTGGIYKSTVYTPQVSTNVQPISASSTFNSSTDKGLSGTKYRQEALIKTYASQEARKRPLSSNMKPLSQIKTSDKVFPELNPKDSSHKPRNDESNERASNQENIRLKYKLTRKEEGSFEISTPKDNFTQLLSENNKKAYDQQLKEIKSTLKSMRITKNLSPSANDSKDLKKPVERVVELTGKAKRQQPIQSQNNDDIQSSPQASKDKTSIEPLNQTQKEKIEPRESSVSNEKAFMKPTLPKNLVSNVYRNPARIKVKDLEISKTNISPDIAEKTVQSIAKVGNEENTNENEQNNIATLKQIRLKYYANSLKKHWKRYNDKDYFCRLYREHFYQIFQEMKACKAVRPVDSNILNKKSVYLQKRESHKDKKTLIFDLDETLVHCNPSERMPCDVVLPIKLIDGTIVKAGINIRPYAVECLKEMSQHFEVIIFTASHSSYANVILDYLDPNREYIHHRLYRESCISTKEGMNIKDLRILKERNLSDMVLVDNSGNSFAYQINNGVPIAPFYENKADKELLDLMEYMKSIKMEPDLRIPNKQTFKLHAYAKYNTPKEVLEKVIFAD